LYGWTGRLLRVDLSSSEVKVESIDPQVLRLFMGGKGLGTYYLYREVPPGADPLGPENRFYLATGPCQGTRIPLTGRCTAVSKSPLTGLYIDSGVGGHLGPALKQAGYDLLVIQGRAEEPVWVNVTPEGAEVNDASHLWGKTTHEVEQILRKEDPKIRVLSTGPAGERLVRISCLTHDYFRNFGRGGLGAVFGAKHLKAVAVRGQPDTVIPTPDPKEELELVKHLTDRAKAAKKSNNPLHFHGTPWLVSYSNKVGMFPTRNFQTTYFNEYEGLTPESLEASVNHKLRRTPCHLCPVSCAWTISAPQPWAPKAPEGTVALPEYETLAMLGGNLGVSDPKAIIQANHLCNTYGLDTISTGNTIGLLMELTERGMLPEQYAEEGVRFGDVEGMLHLIGKITHRQGLGDALAEGALRFARSLGPMAEELVIHVKGLEFPAWDPRGRLGLGLSYATAAAGASHLRGWPTTTQPPNESARSILPSLVEQQDLKILKDSLVICHFTHSIKPALNIADCVRIYHTVTGEPATEESVRQVAARTWILARLFNIREYGEEAPRSHDQLPPRLMEQPVPSGPSEGLKAFTSREDYEECLTELYRLRGCDSEGRPTPQSLRQLGLSPFL